jgi:hypothetical protein
MTYFKVDDGIWGHPKFSLLSNDAIALWVMAGSWCGRYVTDGLLPFQSLAMVRGSKQSAQELVDAGLWLETPNGWLFHDWHDYQYTKAEVESRREYEREKKRRQRERTVSEDVPMMSPRESRGESLRESPGSPGEGEGEGKGLSSIVLKNNDGERFDEFWKMYPKKADKAAARRAWDKALRVVSADVLIDGAMRYRNDPNREDAFTKNAATWLNAGSWENDPLPARVSTARKTGGELRMEHYATIADRLNNSRMGQIES